MIIVVFFLIFLPVFSALFFGLKVPNPLKKTDSFSDIVRGLHVFGRKVLRSEALQARHLLID